MSARCLKICIGPLFLAVIRLAAQTEPLTANEARTLSEEVYVFGYPLVLMHATANTWMTEGSRRWNQFFHGREFLT